MKKLIIIIVVILVVAGGGAGGLVMLGIVRNPFMKPPPMDAVAAAAAEADAKATAYKGPTEALTLVKPPDMVIPVIANGTVTKRIYINMRLDVKTADKARVQAELARFESNVLQEMVPYFQTYFEKRDVIDVMEIKKKLNSHAQKVYGEAVNQVLLLNVFAAGGASGAKNSFAEPE